MGRFGLGNLTVNGFHSSSNDDNPHDDDDDYNDYKQQQNTNLHRIEDRYHRQSQPQPQQQQQQQQETVTFLPRGRMEYGSILSHDDGGNGNDNNLPDNQRNPFPSQSKISPQSQNHTRPSWKRHRKQQQQQQQQEIPSLTAAFRSLENRTIVSNCIRYLVIYMTIAVIAYSFVLERWTIIDSLYFAVSIFTTCGYGDKQPTTVPGKLFTIVFAIYGVIILGVFIAIFGSFISDVQIRARKQFQRQHHSQMIHSIFGPPSRRSLTGNTSDNDENNSSNKNVINDVTERGIPGLQSCNQEGMEVNGFWNDHVSFAKDIGKVLCAEFPLILLVGIMGMILGLREGWDWTSTLYFCIMAATTTGYGNYSATNQLDKLYCVLFLPLAVAVFGEILGRIANVYIQRRQRIEQTKFLHRSLTLCDIRNMDSNADGKADMSDFLSFMLIALQKVDRRTIDELKMIFHSLDTNGNGYLDEADLAELVQVNYIDRLRAEWNATSIALDRRLYLRNMQSASASSSSSSSSSSVLSSSEFMERPTVLHQRSHTVV